MSLGHTLAVLISLQRAVSIFERTQAPSRTNPIMARLKALAYRKTLPAAEPSDFPAFLQSHRSSSVSLPFISPEVKRARKKL